MMDYDVIVVGAGIEGLSTANYLQSQKNRRVLILEQFPFPHSRGSSTGQTRITRLAYRRPEYVRLMIDSHTEWRNMEKKSGLQLYKKTGCLVLGSVVNGGKLNQYQTALESQGVDCKRLTCDEVNEKYGHLLTCPSNYEAMLEPDGGILMNKNCLEAYSSEFLKNGGIIKDHVKVLDIIPRADHVRVITTCGMQYVASNVVLTMGPWTSAFLSSRLNLKVPSVPQRTQICYWKEKSYKSFSLDNGTPAVLMAEPDATYFFKPSFEYPGLVHYGIHYGEPLVDVDHPDAKPMTPVYMQKCSENLEKFNIRLAPKPSLVEYCIYQESSDSDFILDKHPVFDNIIYATGFSGHGFKLAPAVGKILAKLAVKEELHSEESIFSLDRFRNKSKL